MLRSPQLQKNAVSELFCFGRTKVLPGAKTIRSADTCASAASVEKLFGLRSFLHHLRQLQNRSVAQGAEKLLSAYIFASVAPVVKTFGRVMRENTSVGSHLCFVTSVAKKLQLADIYTSTAPVQKTSAGGHFYFGRASRKNFQSRQAQKESVGGHM